MIAIKTEQRVDVLRQVAELLTRENDRLHRRIEALLHEVAALKGIPPESVQIELESLREQLAQRERALFGDSSEKRKHICGEQPVAEKAPQVGHGRTAQKKLPVVEEVYHLDEADRICPSCGGALSEMAGQFEDSEEITVIERQFVTKKIRRQKYRCECNGHVEVALGPAKLQPGARYSPEFAVEVAASKYLDHLPLERQVRIMRREGLDVTSQTLWDQCNVVARYLEPTYEAIHREVLAAPVVGADETYWRMMGAKDEKSRWYAWCVSSPTGVYFRILDSRGKDSGREVLSGYQGVIMADGYEVYDALARGDPHLVVANCWAHVRRKFIEAEENFPAACQQVLDLIRDLYAVEASIRDGDESSRLQRLAEERALRSKEILERIRGWAIEQRVLPQSGLGKAIAYMLGLWAGLTRFVADPRIPLDNNGTERALRGPVVGRKNFYGARSRRGTEVAAIFYTLIETAKLRGVEPKAYLRQALYAAIEKPGVVTLPS